MWSVASTVSGPSSSAFNVSIENLIHILLFMWKKGISGVESFFESDADILVCWKFWLYTITSSSFSSFSSSTSVFYCSSLASSCLFPHSLIFTFFLLPFAPPPSPISPFLSLQFCLSAHILFSMFFLWCWRAVPPPSRAVMIPCELLPSRLNYVCIPITRR